MGLCDCVLESFNPSAGVVSEEVTFTGAVWSVRAGLGVEDLRGA